MGQRAILLCKIRNGRVQTTPHTRRRPSYQFATLEFTEPGTRVFFGPRSDSGLNIEGQAGREGEKQRERQRYFCLLERRSRVLQARRLPAERRSREAGQPFGRPHLPLSWCSLWVRPVTAAGTGPGAFQGSTPAPRAGSESASDHFRVSSTQSLALCDCRDRSPRPLPGNTAGRGPSQGPARGEVYTCFLPVMCALVACVVCVPSVRWGILFGESAHESSRFPAGPSGPLPVPGVLGPIPGSSPELGSRRGARAVAPGEGQRAQPTSRPAGLCARFRACHSHCCARLA